MQHEKILLYSIANTVVLELKSDRTEKAVVIQTVRVVILLRMSSKMKYG